MAYGNWTPYYIGGGFFGAIGPRVPRIPDFAKSDYGEPVSIVYGTARVRGRLFWMSNYAPETPALIPGTTTITEAGDSTRVIKDVGVLSSAVCQYGFAEGPIIGFTGRYWRDGIPFDDVLWLVQAYYGVGETTLGARNQAYWDWFDVVVPPYDEQYLLGFSGVALFRSTTFLLPEPNTAPEFHAEVTGFCTSLVEDEADPSEVIVHLLEDTVAGLGLPSGTVEVTVGLDGNAASSFERWCSATGWTVSAALDTERKVIDIVTELLASCNARAVWTGEKILIVPLADIAVGAFTPPAISANLDLSDFKGTTTDAGPVSIERTGFEEVFSSIPVVFANRANDYLPDRSSFTFQTEDTTEVRVEGEPFETVWLKDPTTAAKLSSLLTTQNVWSRNTARFKLGLKHIALQPGDLVTITDSHSGLSMATYRLDTIEYDGDLLVVTAKEWPIGIGTFVADAAGQAQEFIVQPYPSPGGGTPGVFEWYAAAGAIVAVAAGKVWKFGADDGAGWSDVGYNAASALMETIWQYTATQVAPYIQVTGLDLIPAENYVFKLRFQMPNAVDCDEAVWEGKLYWKVGTDDWSSDRSRSFGAGVPGSFGVIVVDMRFLDDKSESDFLTEGNITGLKLVFSSRNGSVVQVDFACTGFPMDGAVDQNLIGAKPGSVTSGLIDSGVVTTDNQTTLPAGWPNPTSEIEPPVGADTNGPEYGNRYNAGASAWAGAFVRRITTTGTGTFPNFALPAFEGEVWRIAVKRKVVSGSGTASVKLDYLDKDGAVVSTDTSDTSSSGTWNDAQIQGVVPATAVSIRASLVAVASSGTLVADFDAISLKRLTAWDEYHATVSDTDVSDDAPVDTVAPASATTATTPSVTVTASYNVGTVTYAWELVSGDSATVNSPTSATTNFSRTVTAASPAAVKVGYYRCKCTDGATGQVVYSPTVKVTTTHLYEPV